MTNIYKQYRDRIAECLKRRAIDFTPTGTSQAVIAAAERKVGFEFPDELRDFLRIFNGGPIGGGTFLIGTSSDDDRPHGIIESLLGIDPCPSVTAMLPKGTVVDHRWKVPQTVPLAFSSIVGDFGLHREYKHNGRHVVLGMYLFGPVFLKVEKMRRDPYGIVFVAATSLTRFLEHLVRNDELNVESRPFWDKEQTLAIDPELEMIQDWPMPWDFRTRDIQPTYTVK